MFRQNFVTRRLKNFRRQSCDAFHSITLRHSSPRQDKEDWHIVITGEMSSFRNTSTKMKNQCILLNLIVYLVNSVGDT